MKAKLISFGILDIDGKRFERDVVIDRGRIARRDKKASKPLRDRYGHTPLSLLEPIPVDVPAPHRRDGRRRVRCPSSRTCSRRRGGGAWSSSRCRPTRPARCWRTPIRPRRTPSSTSPADGPGGDDERHGEMMARAVHAVRGVVSAEASRGHVAIPSPAAQGARRVRHPAGARTPIRRHDRRAGDRRHAGAAGDRPAAGGRPERRGRDARRRRVRGRGHVRRPGADAGPGPGGRAGRRATTSSTRRPCARRPGPRS